MEVAGKKNVEVIITSNMDVSSVKQGAAHMKNHFTGVSQSIGKLNKELTKADDLTEKLLNPTHAGPPGWFSVLARAGAIFGPFAGPYAVPITTASSVGLMLEADGKEAAAAISAARPKAMDNAYNAMLKGYSDHSLNDLDILQTVLKTERENLADWIPRVLGKRDEQASLISAQLGHNVDISTVRFNDKDLAEAFGKSDEELIQNYLALAGKYDAIIELIKNKRIGNMWATSGENQNVLTMQPSVPDKPTPETTLHGQNSAALSSAAASSQPAGKQPGLTTATGKKAATATKEATAAAVEMCGCYDLLHQQITLLEPALKLLSEQFGINSTGISANQSNIETLTEGYRTYTDVLLSVTDKTKDLALIEEHLAQKQSVTSEILNNALTGAQQRVVSLAGESLVQLSNAFAGAIVKGGSFGEALKSIGENILYTVIQMQALSWITSLFGFGGSSASDNFTLSSSILNGYSPSPYGAWGSAVNELISGFAKGGIINQPTLFPFANGIGLMGEAGPEAIMPLGRDRLGNLGVRIAEGAMYGMGASGGVFAPHVEINVENKGGGDMTEEQARALGAQVKALVEMQVAKQMYDYARSGMLRTSTGRGY